MENVERCYIISNENTTIAIEMRNKKFFKNLEKAAIAKDKKERRKLLTVVVVGMNSQQVLRFRGCLQKCEKKS